jgi:hypothetical protein
VNRRTLLVGLIVTPVLMLLVFCSLLGSLTGVYSYTYDDQQVGYIVRRGDAWYGMYGDSSAEGRLKAVLLNTNLVEIEQGFWATTLTFRHPINAPTLYAYSSWNFSVIYDLMVGRDSHLGR